MYDFKQNRPPGGEINLVNLPLYMLRFFRVV